MNGPSCGRSAPFVQPSWLHAQPDTRSIRLDGVEVTFGPEPVQLPPAATFCTRHAKDISNRINEGWSKSCATTYYKQKILKQNPDPYMCE